MAEITETGYKLKTQNQWFDEERGLYVSIDPNWNLDPSTPDGLKLAHDAEIFSALDETLQQAYNSKDPMKAVGVDLAVIGELTGAYASKGSRSSVSLVLGGVAGTLIAANSVFESRTTGSRWVVEQAFTLDGAGAATVEAFSSEIGAIQADPNTINNIVTTVGGLITVNNPSAATLGTDQESDASFRIKRNQSVGRPGNNQIDSLYGELFAVPEVRRVKVYENDTNTTDADGLPPHSTASIVDGGTDDNVALAIYLKKNPGHFLYQAGTPVEVLVTSPRYPTNRKLIKFSRPIYVDMTVAVTIVNDGNLPDDIVDLIKTAYVDFGAGNLIDPSVGFKSLGFDIGEDVPYFTMFTPANKVIGLYGNSFIQSLTLNGGTANVDIEFNELSRWTDSNITVTII